MRERLFQILSALEHLHRHRIAHRDIKMMNIMLDKDHNCKVGDYGLSRYYDADVSLESETLPRGTDDYKPPERMLGLISSNDLVKV